MADLYWQISKEFTDTNLHMLDNEILCDVAFLVGNNNDKAACNMKDLTFSPLVYKKLIEEGVKSSKNATPKKFLAHRFILVSRSPVFERMFVTDMTESKKGVDDPITVVDIDQDTFKEMLRYIYGNKANIYNENVFRLWHTSRKYILEGLEKLCVEYLLNNLSDSIICTTLVHCLFFDSNQMHLKQRYLGFISVELTFLPEEEYMQLSHCAMNEIISRDYFSFFVTELTLYLLIRIWVEPRVRKLGYAVTLTCKTCDKEYSVSSLEIFGSTVEQFDKFELVNETNGNSNDTLSTNIGDFYDTWPFHAVRLKSTNPCTVLNDKECHQLEISDKLVAMKLHSSDSDSSNSDYEEQDTAEDSASGNEVSCDANDSSLASRLFSCGHITATNPEDNVRISASKTDIAKKAAIRHILGDMIYRIRFSLMHADGFAEIIRTSSLLSAEEKNAIYDDMMLRESGQNFMVSGSATFDDNPRIRRYFSTVTRFSEMEVDDSDVEHGGLYVVTSCLSFKVTKPILLKMVDFYTGASSDSEPFRIEMIIKRNDVVISTIDVTIKHNPETGLDAAEFFPSCYITDDTWHEIELIVHPSRGPRYYGLGGSEKLERDKYYEPEFFFKHHSGNTTIEQGQLWSITYSCL